MPRKPSPPPLPPEEEDDDEMRALRALAAQNRTRRQVQENQIMQLGLGKFGERSLKPKSNLIVLILFGVLCIAFAIMVASNM